ncbi:MAG: hypothetical protein ACFB2Z_10560 [Maricaulaceae bacterium]
MKRFLLGGVLLALLVFAGVAAVAGWQALDGVEMSVHGYIALGLGAVLSLALGGGLMSLVFISARRGYDDIEPPAE